MKNAPKQLIKALRAKECVAFVGSGISRWSGLPDWKGLLTTMVTFLSDRGLKPQEQAEIEILIHEQDLLTAASICSSRMRRADLREFFDSVFLDANPLPHRIHKTLTSLGPDSYITTNYDHLIEDAYQSVHSGFVLTPINNDQPVEQARIMKHGASRFIFHPHGTADRINTIIFSREDYRKVLFNSPSVLTSLEHLFLSRPVVYVGFGLRDPDFMMIKDQIASTYQGGEREHVAIVADASDMMCEFWRENYGVHLVSYRTDDVMNTAKADKKKLREGHGALLELLDEIKSQLSEVDSVDTSRSHALRNPVPTKLNSEHWSDFART